MALHSKGQWFDPRQLGKVVNQDKSSWTYTKNAIQRHLLDPTDNNSLIMLLWRSDCKQQ
jgi:hypothetical protein